MAHMFINVHKHALLLNSVLVEAAVLKMLYTAIQIVQLNAHQAPPTEAGNGDNELMNPLRAWGPPSD